MLHPHHTPQRLPYLSVHWLIIVKLIAFVPRSAYRQKSESSAIYTRYSFYWLIIIFYLLAMVDRFLTRLLVWINFRLPMTSISKYSTKLIDVSTKHWGMISLTGDC